MSKPNIKCASCKFHKVISDRCPNDWFNDDDCAVVCTQKAQRPNPESKYLPERQTYKVVSAALRPYEVKKVEAPAWCPLKKKKNVHKSSGGKK